MRSMHWIRTMPALAFLIAALAASAGGGCGGGNDDPDKPNVPGTGGTGGIGDGGSGGAGGVGGSGGGIVERPCETNDDCESHERCDEQTKLCVEKCSRDRDCGLNTGLRCDRENGGICVPGEPCDTASNCGGSRDHDYCKGRHVNCYCQEDQTMQNEEGSFGVCWRVASVCDECDTAEECGGSRDYDCRPFNYGGETRNVCLRKSGGGACGPGTVPGTGEYLGLCLPQFGDCKEFKPCTSNDDCDQRRPICDLSTQICREACTFNYVTNRSQGCGPQQVCHATAAGTDPNVIGDCAAGFIWGQGECASPCVEDSECARFGEGFVCEKYGSENRCVPAAAARRLEPDDPNSPKIGCMSDVECALNDPRVPELGYCDLSTFTCVTDGCRYIDDWRVNCSRPFEDCDANHKCVADPLNDHPEKGICVEKDCIDKGGADAGCTLGEFCANEPYRDMFTGELIEEFVQPPLGVPEGECYPMNEGEWCQTCETDEDCADMAGLTGSDYPPVCLQVSQDLKLCAPGCDYTQECPGRWSCQAAGRIACSSRFDKGVITCSSDDDCEGSSKCVAPVVRGSEWSAPSGMLPHYQNMKLCACDPNDANPCGGGRTCNAGIGTAPEGGEVQGHYCQEVDVCGSNGSCEFFGETMLTNPDDPNSKAPLFLCANDGGVLPGVDVDCPPGTFPGGNRGDRFICISSQVCVPALNRDGACGLEISDD